MSVGPLQLAFYKGAGGNNGALQVNFQRPHYYVVIKVEGKNITLKNFEGKFITKDWKEKYPAQTANLSSDDMTSREGALFIDITSASGKNIYDWESKITMALSIEDMAKVLSFLDGQAEECRLMHDPGAKSASQGKVQKWMSVSSPKGLKVGVLVNVTQKVAGEDKELSHTVPLSASEVKLWSTCIRMAIPAALGWV